MCSNLTEIASGLGLKATTSCEGTIVSFEACSYAAPMAECTNTDSFKQTG